MILKLVSSYPIGLYLAQNIGLVLRMRLQLISNSKHKDSILSLTPLMVDVPLGFISQVLRIVFTIAHRETEIYLEFIVFIC